MIELTPPDSMTTEERSDQISRILILACTRLKEKARRLKKRVPAYFRQQSREDKLCRPDSKRGNRQSDQGQRRKRQGMIQVDVPNIVSQGISMSVGYHKSHTPDIGIDGKTYKNAQDTHKQ